MAGTLSDFLQFVSQESGKLLQQTLVHSGLTFLSLCIAIVIGLPLGILITRKRNLSGIVLGITGVLQTIPSIALLGFMIPLLGIGAGPAIVALFLYALLPIVRNTYTGILEVDAFVKEAAMGMGMSSRQVLWKVELPLAFPVILAGIRTATVINVGVATLAAYIGAGGLGEFIFGGIALNNTSMILAGAIPAALLALLFDFLLSRLQHINLPKVKAAVIPTFIAFAVLSSLYFAPSVLGSKLLAGFPPEFMGRADGYPGLKKTYHLKINTVVVNVAVMYKAVEEKRVDVVSGYSTDGRVKAFHLRILKDDKHVFPPYYAAPLVRQDVLQKYPELRDVLNLLAGQVNDSLMTEMNYQVDYLKKSPQQVAMNFLKSKNLYRPPRNGHRGTIRIGSKIFSEQYILSDIYSMLIKGYTDLDVSTKTGLGGTKICFDALTNDQIDFYPEYTGTGLEVILQAPRRTIDSLVTDKRKVFNYVKAQFQQQYHLEWLQPIGFNNTYALMMRQSQARKLGIKSISDLQHYLSD
ncbi:MAG TPA: ABC transporter permease/substrate-binding protein [Chitinophagaceae bacterium]|nr:ABC transporter permease/substrate-binding protein [Chitinophagaceae bacterium]